MRKYGIVVGSDILLPISQRLTAASSYTPLYSRLGDACHAARKIQKWLEQKGLRGGRVYIVEIRIGGGSYPIIRWIEPQTMKATQQPRFILSPIPTQHVTTR